MTKRRSDPAAFARDAMKRHPVVLEHLRALELQDKVRRDALATRAALLGGQARDD